MIGQFIAKQVAGAVVKKVMQKRAMKKLKDYVEKPNDADKRIDELEIEVAKLKRLSHAQADFVCMDCGCKAIRKTKKNKRRK